MTALRSTGWVALKLAATAAALLLLVQSVSWSIWLLPDVGTESLAELRLAAEQHAERQRHREPVGHHRVQEWPADRPRLFSQAPPLAARVEAGGLPPVHERVPDEPLVIAPPQQRGPYGGQWRIYDVSRIGHIVHMLFTLGNESLIRWDPGGDELIPNIAKRWESSDDAREHTIHLRRGIRWSDGHPFTADDILFWYHDFVRHPTYSGAVPREVLRGGEPMELEKIDDYTLVFRFAEPNPLLPEELASRDPYMHMLHYPKHYLSQYHEDYASPEQLRQAMRAGNHATPRALFNHKQGYTNHECPRLWAWAPRHDPTTQRWVFDRNPYYWKVDDQGNQLPYIDALVLEIFDAELINMRLIAGDFGMQGRRGGLLNYALFQQNAPDGGYEVLEWEHGGGGELALAFNVNREGDPYLRQLFNDRRFRIAMSHAIDRQEINEVQFLGVGTPRQMSPPPGSPYHCPDLERAHIEHDPAKANALLDELGLTQRSPEGFRLRPDGRPLQIFLDVPSGMDATQAIRLVAAHWRAVGIDAKMRTLSGPLISRRQHAARHDMTIWWGENEKHPVMDPRWFAPVTQAAHWAPQYRAWYLQAGEGGREPTGPIREAVDLFDQIMVEPDEARRIELWQRINDLQRENLWTLGIVGQVPHIVLKHHTFRNVPDRAIDGFIFRSTPGVTAPEAYAIEQTPQAAPGDGQP